MISLNRCIGPIHLLGNGFREFGQQNWPRKAIPPSTCHFPYEKIASGEDRLGKYAL